MRAGRQRFRRNYFKSSCNLDGIWTPDNQENEEACITRTYVSDVRKQMTIL